MRLHRSGPPIKFKMSERIAQAIIESVTDARARMSMRTDGDPLRCFLAVSGGEDSHVLLHSFRGLSKELNVELAVAHINPGGSENYDKREKFVRQLAARYKLPLIVHKSPLPNSGARSHAGIVEDRQQFFQRACTSHGADFVVTGTHLEDRLDQLLFELLPATATEIGSMRGNLTNTQIVLNPFHSLERSLLEDYSIQNNLAFLRQGELHASTQARLALRSVVWPMVTKGTSTTVSENLLKVEQLVLGNQLAESVSKNGFHQTGLSIPQKDAEARDEQSSKPLDIPGMIVCQYDDGTLASIEASTTTQESSERGGLSALMEHSGNHLSIAKAYFDARLLPGRTLRTREYLATDVVVTEEGETVSVAQLFTQAGVAEELFTRIPMVLSAGIVIWIPGVYAYAPAAVTQQTKTRIELSYRRRENRIGRMRNVQPASTTATWRSSSDA